jgi:hypothetical protein
MRRPGGVISCGQWILTTVLVAPARREIAIADRRWWQMGGRR